MYLKRKGETEMPALLEKEPSCTMEELLQRAKKLNKNISAKMRAAGIAYKDIKEDVVKARSSIRTSKGPRCY